MQTCDVEMTPPTGPRGTEERLSPNFFEEDRVGVFTGPSEMEQISSDSGRFCAFELLVTRFSIN